MKTSAHRTGSPVCGPSRAKYHAIWYLILVFHLIFEDRAVLSTSSSYWNRTYSSTSVLHLQYPTRPFVYVCTHFSKQLKAPSSTSSHCFFNSISATTCWHSFCLLQSLKPPTFLHYPQSVHRFLSATGPYFPCV